MATLAAINPLHTIKTDFFTAVLPDVAVHSLSSGGALLSPSYLYNKILNYALSDLDSGQTFHKFADLVFVDAD
jgi:hypothetical protein